MRSMISSIVHAEVQADVVECASGLEALKAIPQHAFDLVFTDINMPDINGLELVQFLRSNDEYKQIPLVIISTERGERDQEKGLALGADEYVCKPFAPEELQQLVRKYLDVA